MLGTILVNGSKAHALFDTGATHSFVSTGYASLLSIPAEPLVQPLGVVTPAGSVVVAEQVCRGCEVLVSSLRAGADLIVFTMRDFDVILGMDWLGAQHAQVDCFQRRIVFELPSGVSHVFQGHGSAGMVSLISSLKACRLLDRSEGYLASVVDLDSSTPRLEDIFVVREFADVFPEELPGLPPSREVEFAIEVAPGTEPISKAPYRMALAELKELKG